MKCIRVLRVYIWACVWLGACAEGSLEVAARTEGVVFDTDDRHEYFEESDAATRATLAQSVVALMYTERARALAEGALGRVPSLRTRADLCPGEAFASQPSAALCSGVLLDWDLVLLAKHCIEGVPLRHLAVVFGYYMEAPDQLAVTQQDIFALVDIVAESARPADYVWVRLERPVAPPHRPAPVYTRATEAGVGAPLTVMSATSGIPIKIDRGARVFDSGAPQLDRFVATSDTFQGSSGGGAFDNKLALVGVLADGTRDYETSAQGCRETRRVSAASTTPTETYTYAQRAVQTLCEQYASPLCEASCEQPCVAPRPSNFGSCSAAHPGSVSESIWLLQVCVAWALWRLWSSSVKRSRTRALRRHATQNGRLSCFPRRAAQVSKCKGGRSRTVCALVETLMGKSSAPQVK